MVVLVAAEGRAGLAMTWGVEPLNDFAIALAHSASLLVIFHLLL